MDLFIANENYKEPQNSSDPSIHSLIRDWLDSTLISSFKLNEIAELMKFYGVAFLYEIKDIIEDISPEARKTYQRDLQLIMLVAKDLLAGDIPDELQFLMNVDGVK